MNGPMYPSATAPAIDGKDERLERLRILSQKYEIRPDFCQKLRQLEAFEIIFVCDDSGSMSQIIDADLQIKAAAAGRDPFANTQKTRWQEQASIVTIVSEVAACLDPTGIDVYFLNRPPLHNVYSSAQVQDAFRYPPQGYTPIVNTLNQIMKDRRDLFTEKQVLLILATDGEPTDNNGYPNIPDFVRFVSAKPKNVFMTIVACTDDHASMKYLNKLDKKVANLDVVDDYRSEKDEILKARGSSFRFSFGDYVAKILLGSFDKDIDRLDEKRKNCILS